MNKLLGKLSLKAKLMGFAGILIALLVIASSYAIFAMQSIGKELTTIAEEDIPLTNALSRVATMQLEQAVSFERVLHYGSVLHEEENALSHFRAAIESFDSRSEEVEGEIKTVRKLIEKAMETGSEEEVAEFKAVDKALSEIVEAHRSYVEHAHHSFVVFTEDKAHEAEQLAQKVEQEEEALIQHLETLLGEVETFTSESAMRAEEHEQAAIAVLGIVALFSIVISLVLSVLFASYIVRAIRKATVTASGDLSQEIEITTQDEIGELLKAINGMRLKLLQMLSDISDTTAQLSTASEEMSSVTVRTSETIQNQRSETEQVATAMNEMTTTVQEVAVNINHTASAADEAKSQTREGAAIVKRAISQINVLAEQVESSSRTINELEKHSESINSVLEVIKGIADQTNLLALNAAIEAARAGEQGRGFAVVADEVRTLAGRTRESTDEINDMIDKLQSGSRAAVSVMKQSQNEAKSAVELASQTGEALTTITQAVERISEMATQIASAAQEQGAVSEEINRNIVIINDMSVQTAEGAKETADASKNLAHMATELQGLIEQFKV